MKSGLALQSLTVLKIGELLVTVKSPSLSDLTIWRVIVNVNPPWISVYFGYLSGVTIKKV